MNFYPESCSVDKMSKSFGTVYFVLWFNILYMSLEICERYKQVINPDASNRPSAF